MTLRLVLCCLFAAGCETHDSNQILTSAMSARIQATADGNGETEVRVNLFLGPVGNLDRIELEGDDELWVTAPTGDSVRMSERVFAGTPSYTASFPMEDTDTEFIVEFDRSLDRGAPDTRLTLPEPLQGLTIGDSETPYSRNADDIIVNWVPSMANDDMNWTLSGGCINNLVGTPDGDPGTATIVAGSITSRSETSRDNMCLVTLTVRRTRLGSIDPGYGEGGEASATQEKTIQFMSIP